MDKAARQITEIDRLKFMLLFDEELTTASGLDYAIIGVGVRCGQHPFLIYSVDQVIKILMDRDGMTNDEAIEFFEFNIARCVDGRHHAGLDVPNLRR